MHEMCLRWLRVRNSNRGMKEGRVQSYTIHTMAFNTMSVALRPRTYLEHILQFVETHD